MKAVTQEQPTNSRAAFPTTEEMELKIMELANEHFPPLTREYPPAYTEATQNAARTAYIIAKKEALVEIGNWMRLHELVSEENNKKGLKLYETLAENSLLRSQVEEMRGENERLTSVASQLNGTLESQREILFEILQAPSDRVMEVISKWRNGYGLESTDKPITAGKLTFDPESGELVVKHKES